MNGRTNSSGTTINDLEIPLDPPNNLYLGPGNGIVELTWEDPKDKYATPEGEAMEDTDQLVSVWAYTRIVRKVGSAPTGPNDGTIVLESAVRDQYKETPFTDSGLTNGLNYYYGAYAYNTDGVPSEGNIKFVMVGYYAELNLNTWDQIAKASADGMASSIWSVGDTKIIHLEGTFSGNGPGITISVNMDCNVFITDFNHNPTREISGISFQGFKTLDGKDFAFYPENGSLVAHPNNFSTGNRNNISTFPQSYIDTSIRYNGLGGAGELDPINPENGTVMACLPSELRQHLKKMKKCDINRSGSPVEFEDWLTLYSEWEYAGKTNTNYCDYRTTGEENYQTQYKYYANGNSPIKYKNLSTSYTDYATRTIISWTSQTNHYIGFVNIEYNIYESNGPYPRTDPSSTPVAPGFVI